MNREEAKQALKEGKKLKHTYFTSEEWVQGCHGLYEFEDGGLCTPKDFWYYRQEDSFDQGWSEVSEKGITVTTNPRPEKNYGVFLHFYGAVGNLGIISLEETYPSVGTVGHIDHDVPLQDYSYLEVVYNSDECLGNFDKKTLGNRHTYPHWHKGKY